MASLHKPVGEGLSDPSLVQRVLTGDHDAFQTIVQRYNQTLYRAARAILKDDAEAEDAVQEAYLLGYRAIHKFRGDAKLSTWLVRIVVNEAIGRKRRRRRGADVIQLTVDGTAHEEPAETNMSEATVEQPERAALRAETRRMLEAKIDDLPDAFRTVFMLRAVEEMTVEETAACLDIPEATVRTRFFRARGLLRKAFAREVDFASGDAFAFAGERCNRITARVMEAIRSLAVDSGDPIP